MITIIFRVFPLLAIPIIVYNLMALVFISPNPSDMLTTPDLLTGSVLEAPMQKDQSHSGVVLEHLQTPMISIPMVSGALWTITSGDLLILLAVTCLFMEILKSTSTGAATIINHAISMMLFIMCIVQFLLMKSFATSVFFIITIMSLLDVLAGVIVTIISARRDFAIGNG